MNTFFCFRLSYLENSHQKLYQLTQYEYFCNNPVFSAGFGFLISDSKFEVLLVKKIDPIKFLKYESTTKINKINSNNY